MFAIIRRASLCLQAPNGTCGILIMIALLNRILWEYSLGSGIVQIGSAVGYADSERNIGQGSLDGSSGRCGEDLLVILGKYRAERDVFYIQ